MNLLYYLLSIYFRKPYGRGASFTDAIIEKNGDLINEKIQKILEFQRYILIIIIETLS